MIAGWHERICPNEQVDSMILSIEDLMKYTHALGRRHPELRKYIVLDGPGCDELQLSKLQAALPTMPEIYIRILRKVNLNRITIGYFQLSPDVFPENDLIDNIIACNSPVNPMFDRFRLVGAYGIGSWEADPIGIIYKGGPLEIGQIIWFSSANSSETPSVLADDFEKYLLLAGNLDVLRGEYSECQNRNMAISKFTDCLKHFGCDKIDKTAKTWQMIADVVLS